MYKGKPISGKIELEINEDIKEKQEIIKEKILDRNYDKNLFFNFCMENNKTKGDNLAEWTKEELNNVINSFIEQENKKCLNNFQNQYIQKGSKELGSMNINLNIDYIGKRINENKPKNIRFLDTNCFTLEKSLLNDKYINVEIKNPKPIDAGLLSLNYIIYEVNTKSDSEINWLVHRRYTDFLTLRQLLSKYFPHMMIPPLPGKKVGNRRFDSDFVDKRMHFLNQFLKCLVQNETFKASDILLTFLFVQDRELFDMKMKNLNSIPAPYFVEEMKLLNGKASISYEESSNEYYYNNINNFFNLQSMLYVRLNYNLKNFYKNMNIACISLEEVGKDFELIYHLNQRVKMKDEITNSYLELNKFFKNWKKLLFNQNEVIKKNIKNFYKYVQMEGDAFSSLFILRDEIKKKYENDTIKLEKKKEKYWSQKDRNKWEIKEFGQNIDYFLLLNDKQYAFSKMCTDETNNLNKLRIKFGYASKCYLDELKNLVEKYKSSFIQNLKEFSNEIFMTLTDATAVWTEMASSIDIHQN